MDLTSLGFLALIIVGGGVVAVLGDWLGHRIGKKRLHMKHLRPRTVARLATVLAGMTVPLLTLVAVLLASSDVRQWLIRGREAIRQVTQLEQTQTQLEGSNKDLRDQRDSLTIEVNSNKKQLIVEQNKLKAADADVKDLRQRESALKVRIAAAQSRLRSSLAKLGDTIKALHQVQEGMAQVKHSYDEQKRQLDDQYRQNIELDTEQRKLNKDLADLRTQQAALEVEAKKHLSDYTKQEEELKHEIEAKKLEVDKYQGQVNALSSQLSVIQAMLEQSVNTSRLQPLTFSRGEEVTRLPVEADLTSDAARRAVDLMLHGARVAAEGRGASSLPDGTPAAGLFPRDDNGTQVSTSDQEGALTQAITGQDDNLVLVAYSQLNAFRGEAVALDVRLYRNPLVYKAGRTIASLRISGQLSAGVIYDHVSEFLRTVVRAQAQRDHMIPFVSQGEIYGQVTTTEVLNLVELLMTQDQTVRLEAYVDEDTRAGDPLRLQFRIR